MISIMKNQYLTEILQTLDRNRNEYQQELASLNSEQLNWKPDAENWSVGQCIDHVITTNKQYFKIFESLLNGTKSSNFWEKVPFLPGFFGNFLIKVTQPEITKKNPTVPVFEPSKSEIPEDILNTFFETHKELVEWIKKSDSVDHQKTIVTSPAAKFVVYSLHDVCIILSGHEERHLNQSRNVMKMQGFPS
jgi:DinB superfamily